MTWQGHRVGRVAGGGLANGYRTPPARQSWAIGQTVAVGFVRGLEVVARIAREGEADAFALYQSATGRWYQFAAHAGLYRCDDERDAMT